jgi:YedE family putative selenium metabolism protein
MVIRMAAGDLNAYVGFVGYVVGCGIGTFFLKNGYDTGEDREIPALSGYIIPLALVGGLIAYILIGAPMFNVSESGPGSMHAAVHVSLIAGLVFGAIAQKTRACFAGGIRNAFFMKDFDLLMPILGIFIVLVIFNVVTGKFNPTFIGQPIAHVDHVFNFLPMVGVGLCAVLAGGCPLRQLILTGTGSSDNAANVLGMLVGAAFAHNFGLASGASVIKDGVLTGGPTAAGKVAAVVCLCFALIIGFAQKETK